MKFVKKKKLDVSKFVEKTDLSVISPQVGLGMHDLDAVLNKYERIELGQIPSLYQMNIDLQGASKTGKSELACGNPNCTILRLMDGAAIATRARVRKESVIRIRDVETLRRVMSDLCDWGQRNKKPRQVVIDSMKSVVSLLLDEVVEKYNLKQIDKYSDRLDKGSLQAKQAASAYEIDEIKLWGNVASQVETMLRRLNLAGLSWITITHYGLKLRTEGGPVFKGNMVWSPDVPPSVAQAVSRMADMLIVTEKVADGYMLSYQDVKKYDSIGSRVPLSGSTLVPDFYSKEMQSGTGSRLTSWDFLCHDYDKAVKKLSSQIRLFNSAKQEPTILK